MRIFKFSLTRGDFDDSWFFLNPPTHKDILEGINEHEKLAGKYFKQLYRDFREMLKLIPKDDLRPTQKSNLVSTGGPVKGFGTYNFSAYDLRKN